MKHNFLKRFFSPYLAGPACSVDQCDGQPTFPQTAASCECNVAAGGINELYFVPCTETFSQANITSTAWWTGLLAGDSLTDPKLGRSGLGLGSIGKKGDKKDRVASCRTEEMTSITWALKFAIKCFDKTSARTTAKKMNELILRSNKWLLVARMCDGEDTILPIGQFNTSDFNWTVPDNSEDNQMAEIELSWKELGFPETIDVAGLSAVLPKLR